jgi:hypothetical protein
MLTYSRKKNPMNNSDYIKGQYKKVYQQMTDAAIQNCGETQLRHNLMKKLIKLSAQVDEHNYIKSQRDEWDKF